MAKLTAKQVEAIKEVGRHSIGDRLYLEVDTKGHRRWIFRYQFNGKRRNMGLGRYQQSTNGLGQARKKAAQLDASIALGIDPAEQKKEANEAAKLRASEQLAAESRSRMTFSVCAEEWYEAKRKEWRNKKHTIQVINTLRHYALPILGDLPVADINLSHIKQCLDPIWESKTETANRVRQRIEAVLGYCIANGYREPTNPATWKGLLEAIYTNPTKLKKRKHEQQGTDGHLRALPYEALPDLIADIQKVRGIGAKALLFTILTGSRTAPVRFAKWEGIDWERRIWTTDAVMMKANDPFRVALSQPCVDLLQSLPRLSDYVFSGLRGNPISENTMLSVLARKGYKTQATVHGFRSSFRDFIGEETDFDERTAEFALSHKLKGSTERAYARGSHLEKRFVMMEAWAKYALSKSEAEYAND